MERVPGAPVDFTIEQSELEDLHEELSELGDSMGHTPEKFAAMLTMVSEILCLQVGIQVSSKVERVADA